MHRKAINILIPALSLDLAFVATLHLSSCSLFGNSVAVYPDTEFIEMERSQSFHRPYLYQQF